MPIYPEIKRAEGTFIRTHDPDTFIESITPTEDEFAPVIVYVQFSTRKRWKQTGNCNRCGIGDFNLHDDGSMDFGNYNITVEPGKIVGEMDSVLDADYDTRLDYVCTPDYDRLARKQAAELGIPYVCGLRFETLKWIY